MADINNTEEFIKEFSEFSRITQKDIRYFLQQLGNFIDDSIENQRPFRTNLFILSFKDVKSRNTKMFGELPPTRKISFRLANKYKILQKSANRVYRPVLENIEKERFEPLTD